jgi:hypothetical protein
LLLHCRLVFVLITHVLVVIAIIGELLLLLETSHEENEQRQHCLVRVRDRRRRGRGGGRTLLDKERGQQGDQTARWHRLVIL